MFVNPAIFKKMVKGAYEAGGLGVARTRNKYVIAGNYWCLRCRADAFPAKARAAVVELVSEFPAKGERFIDYKHEEKQRDDFIAHWRFWDENEIETLTGDEQKPEPTCVYIGGGKDTFRMWQKQNGDIIFVPAATDGLVNTKFIDVSCETAPTQAVSLYDNKEKKTDMLYWNNNCCELWVVAAKELVDMKGETAVFETELLGSTLWQQSLGTTI